MQLVARQELAPFMYLDSQQKPRSKFLEYMFEDLFHGREYGDHFVENFETYCRTFFDIHYVAPDVFTNFQAAVRFVSRFGIVSIKPINEQFLADPDFKHCRYQSEIILKKKYSAPYGIDRQCTITVAPTKLAAALIAFVELMREITVAHIENGETTYIH